MPDPTFDRIEELFSTATELTTTARRRYLDSECGDEPELRARVERMLETEADDGFIVSAITDAARDAAADGAADGAAESWIGRELGPYRITGELGHGGMGTVYAAERVDGAYEATVAIKIIRGAVAGGDAFRRFMAERQILGGLAHPNIARLLDAGRTDHGVPYMVMERVEGVAVDRYCDEHRLGLPQRIALFERVCEAVRFAHRGFVVHRDIKPGNILVTADGRPKLLDFGIAKLLDAGDDALTRTATAVMTPAYASPEQLLGGAITQATDVYALGLVLYQLLTGVPAHAFADRSPREVDRVVCRDMPPSPASQYRTGPSRTGPGEATARRAELRRSTPGHLRRALAGDLGTIVETALRKEPERRYPSVNALMEDLRRWREGLPIAARSDTLGYRVRRFVGRHPVGVATAVAVAVLLVAAGAAVFVQGVRAARERDMAEVRRQIAAEVSAFLVDANEPRQGGAGTGAAASSGGESASAAPSPGILARGEERIAALEGRPAVQAGVMAALGRLYHRAGRYGPAGARLEAALARRLALFGPDAGEVAASHQALGDLRLDAGSVEEAIEHYRAALGIRTALPTGHPDRVETRLALARAAAERGDPAADSLYRAVLAGLDGDALTRADIVFARADLYFRDGAVERARALADSAYGLRAVRVPSGHPAVEASRVQRLRFAPRDPEPFAALPEQRVPAGIPTPLDAAVGDFDGDGRLDLVWNHRADRNLVRVAFGTADGGFRPGPVTEIEVEIDPFTDWHAFDLHVGDFDGDGRDDLLWNRLASRNHYVAALGDGSGGFEPGPVAVWTRDAEEGSGPGPPRDDVGTRWHRRGLLVTDFTGDGRDDLFWHDARLLLAWVAVSAGDGRFTFRYTDEVFPYGPGATEGIDVGETLDAVTAVRGPDGLRVVRGRWEAHNEVRVADWDPATAAFRPSRVQRYGNSTFYIYDGVGPWHYYRMKTGDVDGDGLDDLMYVDPATPYRPADAANRVYVARANPGGDPPFDLDMAAHQDSLTRGDPGPFEVRVGDVDGDGRTDLLWDRRTPDGLNRLYVSHGTADARFGPDPGVFVHPEGGDWTRADLFVGDVDGDGRDDAVWTRTGPLIRVHVALGSGSAEPVPAIAPDGP